MSSTITLPVWLVLILAALAVLAVPLVSTILAEAHGPLDPDAIRGRALRWLDEARDVGVHVNPVGEPVIPPTRIVTVLGRHDDVTPFESARTLIGDWRLPRENAFIWRRGHFSVPVTMLRDHAPLYRFRNILNRLA